MKLKIIMLPQDRKDHYLRNALNALYGINIVKEPAIKEEFATGALKMLLEYQPYVEHPYDQIRMRVAIELNRALIDGRQEGLFLNMLISVINCMLGRRE